MEKKDKLMVAMLLGILFVLTSVSMYYVHFSHKKITKERENLYISESVIRVIISNSDFSKIFHQDVVLSSNTGLIMSCGEKTTNYNNKQQWSAKEFFNENPQETMCTFVSGDEVDLSKNQQKLSEDKNGISISSITRGYGQPIYEGKIEVRKTPQGYVVVNEVALETYLRYVVPSEMPASFGQEALKAQAICARNFAYRHMQMPAYIEFDADLDDSIRYQVYNNSNTNEETDKAILSTKGQLLMYNETIVDAYYYSTSWGFTTDLSLWGSEVRPYYQSHWQGDGVRQLDLSKEDIFVETLEEETGAYECSEPWYRWSTTISKERILENLCELELIDLDSLTDVLITKRRVGGSVQEIVFMGREKIVTLTKESEIRKAFHPKVEDVYKNDGTVVHGYEKLPSSFFTIEKNFEGGELVSVTVKGGGCGHGIGMSQNCAKALGNQGKTYKEILQYFYPGTTVQNTENNIEI